MGCGSEPSGERPEFLTLRETQPGQWEYVVVRASTLDNPHRLEDHRLKVIEGNPSETGGGEAVRPNLSLTSAGFYKAKDPRSQLAVSAFLEMSRVLQWEEDLGILNDLPLPRNLALNMNVANHEGRQLFRNAAYFPSLDLIGVFTENQEGIPLAMHPGVLAHENFHAYFNHWASKRLTKRWLDHWKTPLSLYDEDYEQAYCSLPVRAREQMITLWAWDEAGADLWSYLHTGQTTMEGPGVFDHPEDRDIALKPILGAWEKIVHRYASRQPCNFPEFLTYDLGTQVARSLFLIMKGTGLNPAQMAHVLREFFLKWSPLGEWPQRILKSGELTTDFMVFLASNHPSLYLPKEYCSQLIQVNREGRKSLCP